MNTLKNYIFLIQDQLLANPLAQRIWTFYESRTAKERGYLKWIAIFIFAVLLWFAFLSPLSNYANTSQEQYFKTKSDFEWLVANRPMAEKIKQQKQLSMEEVVKSSSLAEFASNISLEGNNKLVLNLSNIPFTILVESLSKFEQDSAIEVLLANITRVEETSGYVNATLTLIRE